MVTQRVFGLLLGVLMTVALTSARATGFGAEPWFRSLEKLHTPAGTNSGSPNLFASTDGQVYLSWLEPLDDVRYALRFAVREAQGWSPPRTIAEGSDWFVNWANFPSLTVLADGRLAAHWLVKSNNGLYGYDVHIAFSSDGGETWGPAIIPYNDNTQTPHGFVSLLPWNKTELLAVWLDGRLMAKLDPSVMTLRAALLDKTGGLIEETQLDEYVCTCCQTATVATPDGAVIAYRDRSVDEVRDIALVRFQDGRWTQPQLLHEDGWQIAGCPVNGPALAAAGQRVAAVWFTGAGDKARVLLAFSDDGGVSFGEPVRIDDGNPLGRVDLVLLMHGAALVSWLELGPSVGEIRLRRVRADGFLEPSIALEGTDTGAISGFPRMVRSGDEVYFAWTQRTTPSLVRSVVLKLGD